MQGKATFQSFWMGGPLGPVARLSIQSFLDHGFRYELYAFGDVGIVPRGVSLRPGAQILSPADSFVEHGEAECLSDHFRYRLLAERGGWWVDTDVVCNCVDLPNTEICFAYEDAQGTVGVGQLRFPPGHELMIAAIGAAQQVGRGAPWGSTGPALLTRLVTERRLGGLRWDRLDLYPLHWAECGKFLLPEFRDEIEERTAHSRFIHLYTSVFRRRFDFDQVRYLPPPGSFLAELYARYIPPRRLEGLFLIDEEALRTRVADYVGQDWVRQVLSDEGLTFRLRA